MSPDQRKQLFNVLCSRSSPNFQKELRSYEAMSQPKSESFEVSCELIDGVRVDQMRVAIMCLYRQEVMNWLVLHHPSIKDVEELLFNNPYEDCFGIGFADYPQEQGVRRVKLYNCYGHQKIQPPMREHIFKLFAMLGLPDEEFREDLQIFDRVRLSCIDWDAEGRPALKVYFGLFHNESLFNDYSNVFSQGEMDRFKELQQQGLMPELFNVGVKYEANKRSVRLDMCCQEGDVQSYLKRFDRQGDIESFLGSYDMFQVRSLQYIGLQVMRVEKVQLYFWLN